MVSLHVLLAVYPPPPPVNCLDDFLRSMPAKPADWLWEQVTETEVGRDLVAMLAASGIAPPYEIQLPNGFGIAVIKPPSP